MPRRQVHPKCKYCGATEADGVVISRRGLCQPCALRREAAAITQVAQRQGEYHERWIAGMMRAAMRAASEHGAAPAGESGSTSPDVVANA